MGVCVAESCAAWVTGLMIPSGLPIPPIPPPGPGTKIQASDLLCPECGKHWQKCRGKSGRQIQIQKKGVPIKKYEMVKTKGDIGKIITVTTILNAIRGAS